MTGLISSSTLNSLACKDMCMVRCVPTPQLHIGEVRMPASLMQCDSQLTNSQPHACVGRPQLVLMVCKEAVGVHGYVQNLRSRQSQALQLLSTQRPASRRMSLDIKSGLQLRRAADAPLQSPRKRTGSHPCQLSLAVNAEGAQEHCACSVCLIPLLIPRQPHGCDDRMQLVSRVCTSHLRLHNMRCAPAAVRPSIATARRTHLPR